jgi:hypothetical protein
MIIRRDWTLREDASSAKGAHGADRRPDRSESRLHHVCSSNMYPQSSDQAETVKVQKPFQPLMARWHDRSRTSRVGLVNECSDQWDNKSGSAATFFL